MKPFILGVKGILCPLCFLLLTSCFKEQEKTAHVEGAENLVTTVHKPLEDGALTGSCIRRLMELDSSALRFLDNGSDADWTLPDWDAWIQASGSSGEVEIFLKPNDVKKESLAALFAFLMDLKAPRLLKLNLEASSKAFRPSFVKNSVEETWFWTVESKSTDALSLKICSYVKSWIHSEQVIKGSGLRQKKRVIKVMCDLRLIEAPVKTVNSGNLEDAVRLTTLPIPIWDNQMGNFPFMNKADCESDKFIKNSKK